MSAAQCFVQPETFTIIDTVHPVTGRSVCFGHTLEEIQRRYPGAIVGNFDEWCHKREESFLTEPEEISEEQWNAMLNVLPPQRWVQERGPYGYAHSFEMCEHRSGRVTSFFVSFQDRHFTYNGVDGTPHLEKVRRCAEAFGIPPYHHINDPMPPPEILASLDTLLAYIAPDEQRHYEENGRPENHIFVAIERLIAWRLAQITQPDPPRDANHQD